MSIFLPSFNVFIVYILVVDNINFIVSGAFTFIFVSSVAVLLILFIVLSEHAIAIGIKPGVDDRISLPLWPFEHVFPFPLVLYFNRIFFFAFIAFTLAPFVSQALIAYRALITT